MSRLLALAVVWLSGLMLTGFIVWSVIDDPRAIIGWVVVALLVLFPLAVRELDL